ncbi:hypothetical protein PR202_gb24094 [Eleusine coracana subsp. coracana]|uniref:Uncharacterized protein n=1 Tax=Eleusine coracana subsp. coracana TaxID=191504 RepID=A0AAV5FL74_ELECO|nr:hypothetical protein PR202_gb24094 [Eleusine coracana subsp. coracana]
MQENVEMAQKRAEDSPQIAEKREEYVKLLERSIDDLECTVRDLENRVRVFMSFVISYLRATVNTQLNSLAGVQETYIMSYWVLRRVRVYFKRRYLKKIQE